jgi:hypothetical protein
MDDEQLANRRDALASYAEELGVDWEARLEGIPGDEPVLMLHALASLLRFDTERVFDPDATVVELVRESARLELQREYAEAAAMADFEVAVHGPLPFRHSDYQLLEAVGTNTFVEDPLRRTFIGRRGDPLMQPYFTVAVKTMYTDESLAASVQVNGTEIGKVAPRPWGGEFMVRNEHVFFPFDPTLLVAYPNTRNEFAIVNAPAGPPLRDRMVWARHILFHHRWGGVH